MLDRSLAQTRSLLSSRGIPCEDDNPYRASELRFDGGEAFAVEIPAINSLRDLVITIKEIQNEGLLCTRFNETHGSHLLSDTEVQEMLRAAAEAGFGLVFGIGPRPEYDIKASFYRTPFGLEMGRQLNNHDALAQAVDEAFRLVSLGCRGLTIYDIGLLKLLAQLREDKLLPPNLRFKTSSHCMASNALIAQIFSELGADSITTAHDLQLPVLSELRRLAPDAVLDVPTDVYRTKGGYIRWFELAEIVQMCSPVFLKMGASIQEHPYASLNEEGVRARVRRIAVGQEYLRKHVPAEYTFLTDRSNLIACVADFGESLAPVA